MAIIKTNDTLDSYLFADTSGDGQMDMTIKLTGVTSEGNISADALLSL